MQADTEHTLQIFELVDLHAPNDEIRWYFEQYYPHAVMMQTRAQAMIALQNDDYQAAMHTVEEGIAHIDVIPFFSLYKYFCTQKM